MSDRGWIGVDLDGTLTKYDGIWRGPEHIGEPIEPMVKRVKDWLEQGLTVKIFTARAFCPAEPQNPATLQPGTYVSGEMKRMERAYAEWRTRWDHYIKAVAAIQTWCLIHFGRVLDVTCTKDFNMVELWDDRCVQIVTNTGERVG